MAQQAFAGLVTEGAKRIAVFRRLISTLQRGEFFGSGLGPVDQPLRVVILREFAARKSQIRVKGIEEEPAGRAIGTDMRMVGWKERMRWAHADGIDAALGCFA